MAMAQLICPPASRVVVAGVIVTARSAFLRTVKVALAASARRAPPTPVSAELVLM